MFLINGYNIKMPRGDSAAIKFTFTSGDGVTPYIFPEGTTCRLDIFPVKGAEPVITKTAGASEQAPDGSVTFVFLPEDTDDPAVPSAVCHYSLRLVGQASADTHIGFPENALFEIGYGSNGGLNDGDRDYINVTVGQAGALSGSHQEQSAANTDCALTSSASGSCITISDAADARVQGIRIRGRTENGVGIGENGLVITFAGSSTYTLTMTSAIPLRSVLEGEETVYDEIDLAAGQAVKRIADDGETVLAVPVVTELSEAEMKAFRKLRTSEGMTIITATDEPIMTVEYIRNTDNGKAAARMQDDLQAQIESTPASASGHIDFDKPLVSSVNTGTVGSFIYTAAEDMTVLAINSESRGEAGSAGSRLSTAGIATTGNTAWTDEQTSGYASSGTRDMTMTMSLIHLSAGDTITFSNTGGRYYTQWRALFRVNRDFTVVNVDFGAYFSAIGNTSNDSHSAAAPADGTYIAFADSVNPTGSGTNYAEIFAAGLPYTKNHPVNTVCIGEYGLASGDTAEMTVAPVYNYVSKIYGLWRIAE